MLNKTTCEAIEFTNDADMVVGIIWKNGSKFMYAEITDDCITNSTDLAGVQDFLDETKAFIDADVST